MWLGITAKNMDEAAHETNNPFAFSDGTEIDESSFVWSWGESEPDYNNGVGDYKCVYVNPQNGKMATDKCDSEVVKYRALCRIEGDCVDASSESERFRANLPVLAVFVWCSIFKTFTAF